MICLRRTRFGIRTMIVGVAVSATACAALFVWLPIVFRRSRIDAILRERYAQSNISNGLHQYRPILSDLRRLKLRDYDRLKSDPEAVIRRLLRSVEASFKVEEIENAPEGIAIEFLDEWLEEVDSVTLARQARHRLFGLAICGTLSDDVRRAMARARVRALTAQPSEPSESLLGWVRFIASIGGLEEIDLLIQLLNSHDPVRVGFVYGSNFIETRWPGLIDRLRPRLDVDQTASETLALPVVIATGAGRRVLLEFVENPKRSTEHRRKAVRLLKRDRGRLILLLAACDNPKRRPSIAAHFGEDKAVSPSVEYQGNLDQTPIAAYAHEAADPADPRPELRRLIHHYDQDCAPPWCKLVNEYDEVDWKIRHGSSPNPEADRVRAERIVRRLRLIEPIALPGIGGWSTVFEQRTSPVSWADWLSAYEQTADDGDPLDVNDSRPTPSAYHTVPAQMLLLKAERTEEAGLLIEVMAEQVRHNPNKLSARDPGSVRTLRRRFAVNFGWDIEAWRACWEQKKSRAD